MSSPDHQEPDRRRFLRQALTLIPVAASGNLLLTSAVKAGESHPQGVSQHYIPLYFNPDEWPFLLAACERLIPTDANGPGAVDQGVPIFIDRQMEAPYGHGGLWYMQPPFHEAVPELGYQSRLTPRETYRLGIAAVNHYCQQQYQKPFHQLTGAQQDACLRGLEQGEITLDALPATQFFEQLLANTQEGYLADPSHGGNQTLASWKLIGFPGARADYTDWVAKPNQPYPLGPVSISSKRTV